MFRKKKPEVLVAGAGPVGQFAALLLARRGIHVQIVDEEWRPATHSYALALHPRSLQLLGEVGLLERIVEAAYRVHAVGLYEGSQRRAQISLSDLTADHSYVAVIKQDVLEHVLEQALGEADVKVRWNHRVSRFQQEPEQVVVTVDKMEKESTGYAAAHTEWVIAKSSDLQVPLVIGADGHRSLIRRQLEIGFDLIGEPQLFAIFEFKTDADLGGEMRLILNERNTNVLWPMPDGYCRFSFELEQGEIPASSRTKDRLLVQLGAARFPVLDEEQLEATLRQRAPWFEGSIEDITWRMVVRFERRLAKAFGQRRMWLAGDAGHMIGPVGVQSMNVGLNEACELAKVIGGILRNGDSVDRLEAYGEGRMREWRHLLGLTGGLRATAAAKPWIGAYAARLLSCLPASGAHLDQLANQLGLEVDRSDVPVA